MKSSKYLNTNEDIFFNKFKQTKNESLEVSTLFNNVISNPKLYGSNDINELEIELKTLRKKLDECINNLDLIDYEYFDAVDRNVYETLLDKYNSKKKLYEKIQNDIYLMNYDLTCLKEIHSKKLRELNKLKSKLNRSQRSLTPRPNWDKCANFIDGGFERWYNISLNKSSDDLVKILLNQFLGLENRTLSKKSSSTFKEPENGSEISLSSIDQSPDYFITAKNYELAKTDLKQFKPVFNRKLNRAELTVCIKEIWDFKVENDYKNKINGILKKENMLNFVIEYYKSKYKCKNLAYEWVVNLKEACARFKYYEDASFMGKVLNDELNQELYYSFYSFVGYLYYVLINDQTEDDFRNKLIKYFPYKTKQNIDELINVLENEKNVYFDNQKLDMEKLFSKTDNGCLNSFLKVLNKQCEND